MPLFRCCCSCIIHYDDFNGTSLSSNWQVHSGTWSLDGSGHLKENGTAGAMIISKIAQPSHLLRQVVVATTHNETSGNKYRVLINNENDGTPSYYVEYDVTAQTLAIYDDSGVLVDSDSIVGATGTSRQIFLCIVDDAITASVSNAVVSKVLGGATPLTNGWYAGLGNGANNTIYWDDFTYYWHWIDRSACSKCMCGCLDADGYKAVADKQLTATFSGTGGCTTLNGLTITLNYNRVDDNWQGSGNVDCNGTVTFSLTLVCADYPSTCTEWALTVSPCVDSDPAGGERTANSGCTCSPINMAFGPFEVDASDLACPCCGYVSTAGTFSVTVTS